MEIVLLTIKEVEDVSKLALSLWPDCDRKELMKEFSILVKEAYTNVFLAKEENEIIGFAHCQLRTEYVEGTETSPVGYLEGIYVEDKFRRKGIATKLLTACENWAKSIGCKEFASDVEIDK